MIFIFLNEIFVFFPRLGPWTLPDLTRSDCQLFWTRFFLSRLELTMLNTWPKNFRDLPSTPFALLNKRLWGLSITSKCSQCSNIRKKVQFQKYKNILFAFSKMAKKINFCTPEESPKIAFLVGFNFFLVQKLIFCPFWNGKECVFVLLQLHFFQF